VTGPGIGTELRARFALLADGLIPGADGMPAPSSLDIAGRQLDAVLASRPDLEEPIRHALEAAAEPADPIAWVEALRAREPESHDALVTAVVAGYYMHPEVQRLLGYPGQEPQEVAVDAYPDYVEEGLLERVYERGPIYRPTPPA
jgi:hypothetical protein